MTPSLTPELALRYLRELSADVRGGVALDGAGRLVAGDPELAGPGADAAAALGPAQAAEAVLRSGAVFAARAGGLTLLVVCGPRAIPPLARQDLAQTVAALGHEPSAAGAGAAAPAGLPRDVAEALISAAPRGPGE
ncbi:MAG TPA: hypothetical protein VF533_24950 [Solirubrobacteraceae bacterium]|jgi:hypothetical protein